MRRVEITDRCDGRIVRPVERIVELAQLLDRHLLDVAAPADRHMVIRLRLESGSEDLFVEGVARAVLSALVFIANDRHLCLAIGLTQPQVAHPVGLDRDIAFELVLADGGEIVGAVE